MSDTSFTIFLIAYMCFSAFALYVFTRPVKVGFPKLKNAPKPPLENHRINYEKPLAEFSLSLAKLRLECLQIVLEKSKADNSLREKSLETILKETNDLFVFIYPVGK